MRDLVSRSSAGTTQPSPYRPKRIDVKPPQLRHRSEHQEVDDRMEHVDPLDPLHVGEEPLVLAPLARGDLDDGPERRAGREDPARTVVDVIPTLIRIVCEIIFAGEDALCEAGDKDGEIDNGVEERHD